MRKPNRKRSQVTLSFKVAGTQQVEYGIFRKVVEYSEEVRDRFFDLFYDAVVEFADMYIERGRIHTNTDPTGTLLESVTRDFTSSDDTLHIYLDSSIAPYASIRNLPEGQGQFIFPKREMYLKFFWHRTQSWQRRRFVFSPGNAFFSKAWMDAYGDVDTLLEEAKREVRYNND